MNFWMKLGSIAGVVATLIGLWAGFGLPKLAWSTDVDSVELQVIEIGLDYFATKQYQLGKEQIELEEKLRKPNDPEFNKLLREQLERTKTEEDNLKRKLEQLEKRGIELKTR